MDLIELNKQILSLKKDHMKHSIKYRKVIQKVIKHSKIPDVLYKVIQNFLGSSKFPMDIYSIHPRSFPRNTVKFHRLALEEKNELEQ